MENIVIERVRIIKKNENLTNEKFAERTYLSVDTVKSMFSKKTNPSLETIQKIFNAFPHYNLEWIIIGVGDMYKQNNISIVAETYPEYQNSTYKYIQQLETENKRVIADNQRKQELIDSFLSGAIIVTKKNAV